MTLADKRRAIRQLIDEQDPADAMAAHYAFHYAEAKTQLVTYPADAGPGEARGYIALSRTGIDLFRPYVTLRLPMDDMAACVDLIHSALPSGAAVFLSSPSNYLPLIRSLFDIQTEERLRLFLLDRGRFEPIINVLVVQAESPNNLPRFVIRHNTGKGNEVVASAGLNWQTPHYAEISVNVDPRYRRRAWGRSVLSAMVQHLMNSGRMPLYMAAEANEASINLARSVGFVDSRAREILIEGVLKPRP